MWISSHIRPNRTQSVFSFRPMMRTGACGASRRAPNMVLLLAVLTGLFAGGCASAPKFVDDRPEPQIIAQNIPAPIFDAPLFDSSESRDHTGTSARSDSSDSSSRKRRRHRATAQPPQAVAIPGPFNWKAVARSAGGRDIQAASVGKGGYRVLILGSLAGHDPLAIQLIEQLAQHLHENQIVFGGVEAQVVRTVNPDGEAMRRMENENGVYLNREFTAAATPDQQESQDAEPEVRFVLNLLADTQPQRVIHIRTVRRPQGVVAASSGAEDVARDVCDWVDFQFVAYPGTSAKGTLERFVSGSEAAEAVTFAIPASADKRTLWENYGHALLNLLLADDYETRQLARSRKQPMSASRPQPSPSSASD